MVERKQVLTSLCPVLHFSPRVIICLRFSNQVYGQQVTAASVPQAGICAQENVIASAYLVAFYVTVHIITRDAATVKRKIKRYFT